MKKILSIILVTSMLLVMIPTMVVSVAAEDAVSSSNAAPLPYEVSIDFDSRTEDGKFEDTVADHDSTIVCGVTTEPRGEGYAVSLNGGYLDLKDSSGFGEMQDFALSFDMKTNSTVQVCMYDKYGPNSVGSFYVDIYQNDFRAIINRTVYSVPVDTDGAFALRDGNWHNVKIEVDTTNSTVEVYFDEQLQISDSLTGSVVPATDQVARIGADRNGRALFYGSIDNFSISSLSASAEEPLPYEVSIDFDSRTADGNFEDTVADHDAVITGTSIFDEARGEGYAVLFNGGYLELTGSNEFGEMEDFALSFDLKTDKTGDVCLFDKYGRDGSEALYVDIYNSELRVIINGGLLSVPIDADGAFALRDGNWHSVKIEVDTTFSTVKVYFDGLLQGSGSVTGSVVKANTQLARIGANRSGKSPFYGSIDNFSISSLPAPNAYVGVQSKTYTHETKGDCYAVRFLQTIDESVLTSCTSAGFEITADYGAETVKDCSKDTNTVYTSVIAAGETIKAADLKKSTDTYTHEYIVALSVIDIAVDTYDNIMFTVKPYVVKTTGEKVYAGEYTVIYNDGVNMSVCPNAGDGSTTHIAGEDDGNCTTPINCVNCGNVAIPAKAAHKAQTDSHKCANCDEIISSCEGHYDDGVASSDPCNSVDSMIYTCEICGRTKPGLGHIDANADNTCDRCSTAISFTANAENCMYNGYEEGGTPVKNLFDGSTATKWYSGDGYYDVAYPGDHNLVIKYSDYVNAYGYTMVMANDSIKWGRDPVKWIVYGSNDDGTTWTEIQVIEDGDFTANYESKSFEFTDPVVYKWYKIAFVSLSGGTANGCGVQLSEFNMNLGTSSNS